MRITRALTAVLAVTAIGTALPARLAAQTPPTRTSQAAMKRNVHAFSMNAIDGKEKKLSSYRGSVLLIVNVASKCGYTRQYASLQKLYERYKDRGLRILGFPANNFGAQEPGTNADIATFCSTTYNVTFDMFEKISVKGDDIHPLYALLTTTPGFDGDIGWNFTKFLVGKDGEVAGRFDTKTDPLSENVTSAIEKLLGGS